MKSGFQHFMEKGVLAFLALSMIFLVCWLVWGHGVFLTLLITFATFFYHFAVRLAVGAAVDRITAHGVNYNAAWFRQSRAEAKLYRLLKVQLESEAADICPRELLAEREHTREGRLQHVLR